MATALDKIRPCNAAEILAHQVLSRGYDINRHRGQQGFVDQRLAEYQIPSDEECEDMDEDDDDLSQNGQVDPALHEVPIPMTDGNIRNRDDTETPVSRNVRQCTDPESTSVESRATGGYLVSRWERTVAEGSDISVL